MITFTVADITAARDNDLEATQLLMDAVLPMVDNIARKLASEVSRYGSDLEEELAAEGRMELWRLISEHDGSERHGSGWLVTSIRAAMINARAELVNPGASRREVETYLTCLKRTDYDAAAALKAAMELPAGKRLSAAAAYAAQQAVTPTLSSDTTYSPLNNSVDSANPSAVSSLQDIISDDDEDDEIDWQHQVLISAVRNTLDLMSDRQAGIVMGFHGYEHDRQTIAEDLGCTVDQVRSSKTLAERAFHTKFPWSDVFSGPKPPLNPNRDSRAK